MSAPRYLIFVHEHDDPDVGGLNALRATAATEDEAEQEVEKILQEEEIDRDGYGFHNYVYIEALDTVDMQTYRWSYESKSWAGPYQLGLDE